jgi:Fic/DOC family
MSSDFLTLDEVLEIHRDPIERYGGGEGIRDLGLLQSELAQPSATFGGQYLHADLHEMAAAYLYHLVQNHPFLDGNRGEKGKEERKVLFFMWISTKLLSHFFHALSPSFTFRLSENAVLFHFRAAVSSSCFTSISTRSRYSRCD